MDGAFAVSESCGSVPFADGQRPMLQQRGIMADVAGNMKAQRSVENTPGDTQRSTADAVRRTPLQEANRDISAHPVRVSNAQGAAPCTSIAMFRHKRCRPYNRTC